MKCEVNDQMILKIMQHVQVNPTTKSNIVQVKIDENATCEIYEITSYTYSLKEEPLLDNFSKDAFYTAVGCTIADWTLNTI